MPLTRGLLLALAALACAPDERPEVATPCLPPPDVGQAQWREVHHDAGSFRLPSRYEYDTTAIVPGEDYVAVRYKAGPDRMSLTHGGYGTSTKPQYGAIDHSICRATIGGR